ncbi:LytR C-terminal domain-containing protein [Microbacterium sp. EF45047]|uniref:LytR C-terminal domain-containing protein n=1 Tax=Microbacterium sp. EF45047 TaxID=2809708 RepID=UPI00300E4A0A
MSTPPRDRFDEVPRSTGRVGAHRAEAPGMNGWIVLLWSAAAALVLIVGGIFASLVVMGRIDLFPEAAPVTTSTPGVKGEIDTSYRVMILNATPDEGLGEELRQTLLDNGWTAETVFASDGASEDFPQTTVYFVDDADVSAALGLAELIGGAEVEKSDFYAGLNDSDSPQLTVVLGLDKAAAAPETPAE